MKRWLRAFTTYRDPKILSILFLGFSSGLPFLLILATLSVWLAESGVSKTQIGILAWVTIPYTLKFLWAPLVDHFKIPFMCQFFGQRRGWMLTSQVCLMISLVALGLTDPSQNMLQTSLWAFLVGLFSALQDIVVEAFRIEALPRNRIGYGASASVLGYRLGMLVSGAGALYLAAFFGSWAVTYSIMAGCLAIGMVASLLSTEPPRRGVVQEGVLALGQTSRHPPKSLYKRFEGIFVEPFRHFVTGGEWVLILPFILLYKVGDTVLNTMSMPFLIEVGFSKVEIAHVAKTFGIGAMIMGGLIGGVLLNRFSLRSNLIFCTSLQLLASSCFMIQAQVGHHLPFLFLTMGIENLSCGMSQVALIAYFSVLCRGPHTATHYAVLSSFGSLCRVVLSMAAGWLADQMLWSQFYGVVSFGCLPALFLVLMFSPHFRSTSFQGWKRREDLSPKRSLLTGH